MTYWEPASSNPKTIEESYNALRFHCARLEELLESSSHSLDEKALKRSDKAVTVMKVGFKILKKAIRKRTSITGEIECQTKRHPSTSSPAAVVLFTTRRAEQS